MPTSLLECIGIEDSIAYFGSMSRVHATSHARRHVAAPARDAACRMATDTKGDIALRCLFVLGSDNYDTFVSMLDNSPAPGPKLTALMRRVPAWRK